MFYSFYSIIFYRFVLITIRVMVCLAPANTPPPAESFMSASISSRRIASLALDAREATELMKKALSFSKDSVRGISKASTRSTGINSSSLQNKRVKLLFQVTTLCLCSLFYRQRICDIHPCISISVSSGDIYSSAAFPAAFENQLWTPLQTKQRCR